MDHSEALDELLDKGFKELKLSSMEAKKLQPSNAKTTPDINQNQMEANFSKFLSSGLEGLDGMTNDDIQELDKLVDEMVKELTSDEILAEPFKELAEHYPSWLEKNTALSDDVRGKYSRQCSIVVQINELFQSSKSVPEQNKNARQSQIFDLLQEMQELGSPPEELLEMLGMKSDLPEGGSSSVPECLPQ